MTVDEKPHIFGCYTARRGWEWAYEPGPIRSLNDLAQRWCTRQNRGPFCRHAGIIAWSVFATSAGIEFSSARDTVQRIRYALRKNNMCAGG